MSKGSGSSKKLRNELNTTQVENHVPNVDNSVAFAKYLTHAGNLYKTALDSYKQRNWQYAYVQYKILISFCVKLVKHKAYKEVQHDKDREVLKKYIDEAFKILEYVVSRLDEIEDEKIKRNEFALMDELESLMEEDDDESSPPVASSAVQHDVPPTDPLLHESHIQSNLMPNAQLVNIENSYIRFAYAVLR